MNIKKALYLKLYEELRSEITRGIWRFGERLPSRRQIALDKGVSVITVEHSYELLCQEGYAESRPRSGFFVIYRESDGFAVTELPQHKANTEIAQNAERTFPFTVLARAMRRVISEYGEKILDKSPNSGCDELRGAIKRYLERNRGIHAEAEQIVIGSGAEYLYGIIVEMLGVERIYGIESPSYEKIEQVYLAKGVTCELLPLGHDGIRSTALATTDASVLHITPFRSYPSGVTASASKRSEYIRWVGKNDRYIVEDDFESEFSLLRKPEETIYSQSGEHRVIYLNTFTRTVCPSIRVGYMVLPIDLVDQFESRVGFYSCTVPAFEQYMLAELMDSGDFERHINRIRRQKRKQYTG